MARRPGPIDPDVLAQVEKHTGKKPITERPADLLEPGMEKYRKQCARKGPADDDEIVVLFAMFPQQVEALLKPKAGCRRSGRSGRRRSGRRAPAAARQRPRQTFVRHRRTASATT